MHGETDVAASIYGNFPGSSAGNGTLQSPSNAAGLLLEMRHISNPLVGYELNFSMNGADQQYNAQSIKAHAHQVGASWIVSMPVLSIRPFLEAGGGLLFFGPSSGQPDASSETKPVFVFGAGADWTFLPHFGLRFQYRGDLYHAPDLSKTANATHELTEAAQPMLGAYFRF